MKGPTVVFWGKGNTAGISLTAFLCFLKIPGWVEKIIREIEYLLGLETQLWLDISHKLISATIALSEEKQRFSTVVTCVSKNWTGNH